MDTDYFLDTLQWIFVVLETLSLFVFVYYIYGYCKTYGKKRNERDSYTISCFFFILMTVSTRIVSKFIMLIIKQLRMDYRMKNNNKDPLWYLEFQNEISCEVKISSYLPTGLFTIAIFINATRWLHLIIIN